MSGAPEFLSPFAGLTIAGWLRNLAQAQPDKPILVFAPDSGSITTWTRARFIHDISCVAAGLRARGVGVGDRVLVHLENCPETLIVRFACAWIGAVCVGSNPMAAGPEIAHFVESTGVVGAVTQPKLASLVANHAKGLRWLAVTADDAGTPAAAADRPERALRFEELFGEAIEPTPLTPDAPASIMFTTGTTSRPKGVVWTHANVLWGGRVNALQQGMREEDVSLVFLPLFHVVGLSWCTLSTLWAGGTVVLQPRFSASRYWPVAEAFRASVGSHVLATLRILSRQDIPRHSFRRFVYARHEPEEEARFGVDFVSGWGMTEMLTQAIVCEPGSMAPKHVVGRASIGVRVRIVDLAGEMVRPGESGELLVQGVRGLSIFKEYDGNAAANAEAFDDFGYFRTGDRVQLREDGWISFEDRIKDVLKVGGEGVSAAEIESVVDSVAGVRDVAVVSRPHDIYDEVPIAFVVPTNPLSAEEKEALSARILEKCRSDLAKFKIPHGVFFLDDLPRVGFGKINKVRLREMARS